MIITNSRYALVGYFITSYPTRAHGIIVIYSYKFSLRMGSWFNDRPRLNFLAFYIDGQESCDVGLKSDSYLFREIWLSEQFLY